MSLKRKGGIGVGWAGGGGVREGRRRKGGAWQGRWGWTGWRLGEWSFSDWGGDIEVNRANLDSQSPSMDEAAHVERCPSDGLPSTGRGEYLGTAWVVQGDGG